MTNRVSCLGWRACIPLSAAACGDEPETAAWRLCPFVGSFALIPDCGDTDSSAAPSALSMPPISHWTTVGFCNGCPGGAARSMSQGLRVLVLVVPSQLLSHWLSPEHSCFSGSIPPSHL